MQAIKRSQICIDRAEAIIINAGGKAHGTGYFASNFHGMGVRTIHVYKGKCTQQHGCFAYEFTGDPVLSYTSGQPFPAAEFFTAVGLNYTIID